MDAIQRLEELCAGRNWSFYELAQQADILFATVYKWKNGKANMSAASLKKICGVFDISMEQFWSGIGDDSLTEDQKMLLIKYASLRDEDKQIVNSLIDYCIQKNHASEKKARDDK